MAVYEFAELRVQMNNRLKFVAELCKDYLSADQSSAVDIAVRVSNEEFYKEKDLAVGFSDGYIESICIYRNLCLKLPKFNRFLLHSSVIDYNGAGYAFLGKSGAGKSTHSFLWLKYLPEAKIINGDKPILAVEQDKITAYGTPWAGKERREENAKTCLKGLCFIEQAKTNSIERLNLKETVERVFSQVLLPMDEECSAKTLELIDLLIKQVPAYLLKCDISKNAFMTSFEKMTGEKYLGKNDED